MASKPIQVSIDIELLKRVDRDPETKRDGRSAFIRNAVELYLRAKQRREIDRAIRRAYSDSAEELLSEVDELSEAQSWRRIHSDRAAPAGVI